MREDSYTTLSRGQSYLGSLGRLLRDLAGFSTLAFELIQNADDAPGATRLIFELRPDALLVRNNGIFTDCKHQELDADDCPRLAAKGHRCDFHSFRSVSSGDKRARAGTTGAFGIGFTAVYQITDAPELISSGRHWYLDETLAEADRIGVCPGCAACRSSSGTTFVLPWATDPDSPFRKGTGSAALKLEDPETLWGVLRSVVPEAMVFLRKLHLIRLVRDGDTLDWEREPVEDVVAITDGTEWQEWKLFTGDFGAKAAALREEFPDKIEETRSAGVTVALRVGEAGTGRLSAFLPTEEAIPLPVRVNADFCPASDRKHLVFEGFQGSWNRAAMACAAEVLARNLADLREFLPSTEVWGLILKAYECRSKPNAPDDAVGPDRGIGAFWDAIQSSLQHGSLAIMPTSSGRWVSPGEAVVTKASEEADAIPVLESLGILLVHPDVQGLIARLPRAVVGVSELGVAHVVAALRSTSVKGGVSPNGLPLCLTDARLMEQFRRELEILLGRPESRTHRESLSSIPILPDRRGDLRQPRELLRADARTAELFGTLCPGTTFLDETRLPKGLDRLMGLCQEFTPQTALDLLVRRQADVREALATAMVRPADIIGWFRRREDEVLADPHLTRLLRSLPLYPSGGSHRPLTELKLPGFSDPLGLASLLAVEEVQDDVSFLRKLGVQELSLRTYILDVLPSAVEDPTLLSDGRWHKVVKLLATKVGEFGDDDEIRRVLSSLPLVECTSDGARGFRVAAKAYLDSDSVSDTLGSAYPRAVLPSGRTSLKLLYDWLGVPSVPRLSDILDRLRTIIRTPPDAQNRAAVTRIVQRRK